MHCDPNIALTSFLEVIVQTRDSILFYSVLFYSILGCVLSLQEVALHQSPLSVLCYPCPYRSLLPHNVISVLVHTAPCCPTMSSLSLSIPLPVAPQCHLCPCPYRSLLPHNVISVLVHTAPCCPTMSSLSLSIPLPVAPQCHLCPCPYCFLLPHNVIFPATSWSPD